MYILLKILTKYRYHIHIYLFVFQIFDNHLTVPHEAIDYLKAPRGFPVSVAKLALTKLSLLWQIFGGNDFSESRQMKSNTKVKRRKKSKLLIVLRLRLRFRN
jgi:hypothetical protein